MFEGLSAYVRGLICVLVSFGLHAGLVLTDWLPGSNALVSVNSPVEVSLQTVTCPESAVPQKSPVIAPDEPTVHNTPMARPAAKRVATEKKSASKKSPVVEITSTTVLKPPVEEPLPERNELVCEVAQEMVNNSISAERLLPSIMSSALSESASRESDSMVDEIVASASSTSDSSPSGGAITMVDAFPHYRSNPLPEYPAIARQKHWEGVVWLQVDVSADGLVKTLRLERSCGYKILDRSARKAVRRWRFTPATRSGIAVESRVRIPVHFRLEDG